MKLSERGYLYIYKCFVGTPKNLCKIGVTVHFKDNQDRIVQHLRTPYFGFAPYADFLTGEPIVTCYEVKNMKLAEDLVTELFQKLQISDLEIFRIDYDSAIQDIYKLLRDEKQLISFVGDGYSDCSFAIPNTSKAVFQDVINSLVDKFDVLPDEILNLSKDKIHFITKCNSHYIRGNYIDISNERVLDLNVSKDSKIELLNKLYSWL